LILLDTHVVVWLASGDPRISRPAQSAIDEARQSKRPLAISDFTLFELSLLFRKKKFDLVVTPEDFLSEVERRFAVLPVTANIALQAFELPKNFPLITADREIRKSRAVPTIW
jgi:PIN domain nuclease of toxin-antitoxin system